MNEDEEYEMVTTVDELLRRLQLANEQKPSLSADPKSALLLLLGLPPPPEVCNAELEVLKPLYIRLIKDIREKKENSVYLRCLFERKSDEPQDAAMLMLYVLVYPGEVRYVRADISGLAGRTNRERFQLVDIADEIAADATIGNWCRTAIREHEPHNVVVLACCLGLLEQSVSPGLIPRHQAKKTVRNNVFQGNDSKKGFAELRTDLAKLVLERTDLHPYVVSTIHLQVYSLAALYDLKTVRDIMKKASGKEPFKRALSRVQDVLGSGKYLAMLKELGVEISHAESDQALEAISSHRATATKQIVVCNKKGCNKKGTSKCGKCKLVSYCSKDCQVEDWKVGGHKQVCKCRVQSTAATTPQEPSSALLKQERLLAQDLGLGQVDYVVDMPTGDQYAGLTFGEAMGNMFKILQQKAPESPYAVYKMYEMLSQNNLGIEERIISQQLEREYGIDPLSDEAKNAPRGDIDVAYLQHALAALTQDG